MSLRADKHEIDHSDRMRDLLEEMEEDAADDENYTNSAYLEKLREEKEQLARRLQYKESKPEKDHKDKLRKLKREIGTLAEQLETTNLDYELAVTEIANLKDMVKATIEKNNELLYAIGQAPTIEEVKKIIEKYNPKSLIIKNDLNK